MNNNGELINDVLKNTLVNVHVNVSWLHLRETENEKVHDSIL